MPQRRKTIMRSLTIKELSGVDRPAQVGARALIMKRADDTDYRPDDDDELTPEYVADLMKRGKAALTSAIDGHTHLVLLEDFNEKEVVSGITTWQDEHQHPWILRDDGRIIIGTVDDHTHEVDVLSKVARQQIEDDEKNKRRKKEKGHRDMSDVHKGSRLARILNTAIDGKKSDDMTRADIVGRLASAAGISESTVNSILSGDVIKPPENRLRGFARVLNVGLNRLTAAAETDGDKESEPNFPSNRRTKKGDDMNDETRIAELEKQLKLAETIAKFDGDVKAHFDKLSDEKEIVAFLALSADEQKAEVDKIKKAKTEADPVVYKTTAGVELRKSDGLALIEMAKQNDLQAKENANLKKKIEDQDLRKRAESELEFMPGTVETRMAMLKSIDGIEDEKERKLAHESLKAQNESMSVAFKERGSGDAPPADGSAEDELNKLAKAHQKDNPKLTKEQAYAAVLDTEKGADLYTKSLN